jgi:4-hydroxy-3-methylbut-2-enyl diphosphate reductase
MDKKTFYEIKAAIEGKIKEVIHDGDVPGTMFLARDTLCKAVYGREDSLKEFAAKNDVILFVAGKNSSNGKSLFNVCQSQNRNTFLIEDIQEIENSWFRGVSNVGITGATSTPQWYLKKVKQEIENRFCHAEKN